MLNDKQSAGKSLAKNTAILTFGMICTQGLGFFLLPLYTSILSTEEYGTYDLLITYSTLLYPIVGAQFEQGMFRFMLDVRGDEKKQSELFSTVLVSDIVRIVVYLVLLGIVSRFIHVNHALFLALYVCMQVIYNFLIQFVRGLGKNVVYATANFLSAGLTIIFNVIFLIVFKTGLQGMFLSVLIGSGIAIAYLCIRVRAWRYFSLKYINKDTERAIRAYSLPLIPNVLSWWIVDTSDRTIIKFFLGLGSVGIYTAANKFSNVFITVFNVFNVSWTETVSMYFHNEDRESVLSDLITIMYRLFAAMCLGITACMPFVFPLMVNVKFHEGYNQVLILMYAMLLRVVVGLYSTVYVATKQSGKIASTSTIAAIVNIIVNVALIKFIGLYAASISTLVAFGVMSVIRAIDVNKTTGIHIDNKALLSTIVMAIPLTISYYLNRTPLNIIMLIVVTVFAVYTNKGVLNTAYKFLRNKIQSRRQQ